MTDLSTMSDEELENLHKNMKDSPASDLSSMSDEDLQKLHDTMPDTVDIFAGKAADILKSGAGKVLGGIGYLANKAESYIGAPINAGVGKALAGGSLNESLGAAARQFGEDPTKAPSDTEIMASIGIPNDPTKGLHTGFKTDLSGKDVVITPAGAAGAVYGTIKDPLTYTGFGIEKGMAKMAPGLVEHLEKVAAGRGFKAAVGQNKRAFKEANKVGQLDKFGKAYIAADEAGPAIVGPLSRIEDIQPRAEAKRQFFGQKIGEVSDAIDQAFPNSISGEDIANKIDAYRNSIVPTPKNSAVIAQLEKEAEYYRSKGFMSFKDAQKHKGSYNFKTTDSTTQVLGQDATNATKKIISQSMDEAAEKVTKIPTLTKQLEDSGWSFHVDDIPEGPSGVPQKNVSMYDQGGKWVGQISFDVSDKGLTKGLSAVHPEYKDLPIEQMASFKASGADPSDLVKKYRDLKHKYAAYRFASDKGADRLAAIGANRFVSPSDYGMGAAAGLMTSHGGVTPGSAAAAIAGGAANKVLRERGSAMAARGADAIAATISKTPEKFAKWMPAIKRSLESAPAALELTHHLLMNNDPDYAKQFSEASQ